MLTEPAPPCLVLVRAPPSSSESISWSTEERARRALRNVSRLLRPGGHFIGTTVDANVLVRKLREADGTRFGNSIVEVTFDERHKSKLFPPEGAGPDGGGGPFGLQYTFTLQDAVTECDEWMVPKAMFVELAEEYGLELVEWRNFHDYVHRTLSGAGDGGDGNGRPGGISKETAHALWRTSMGGKGVSERTLSEDEWEAAYLYAVFVFRMGGSATKAAAAILNRPEPPQPARVLPEDVLVLEGAA